jgi:trichothecene 3-O-acetyltransferase
MPVFLAQANLMKGGILLCVASMHNALDMNGQRTMLKMFAAAGRGEEYDPKLIVAANRDADTVVPFLKKGEPHADHGFMRRPSTLQVTPQPKSPPRPIAWHYWRFPANVLEDLKQEASSGRTWVSTNDALTSFLVLRLTALRVREGRVARDEMVQLQRAVDSRSVLNPPVENYLGHLVSLAETT